MARITVEDCIDKLPSRFELVLVASNRARKLHSGETPTVEKNNDKNTVIALREIAEETIPIEEMKKNLVEDYQTISLSEEEEELSLENSADEEKDNINLDSDDEEKDNINLDSDDEEKDNINLDEENQNLDYNEESEVNYSNNINEISNEIDNENNNSNSESEILK